MFLEKDAQLGKSSRKITFLWRTEDRCFIFVVSWATENKKKEANINIQCKTNYKYHWSSTYVAWTSIWVLTLNKIKFEQLSYICFFNKFKRNNIYHSKIKVLEAGRQEIYKELWGLYTHVAQKKGIGCNISLNPTRSLEFTIRGCLIGIYISRDISMTGK